MTTILLTALVPVFFTLALGWFSGIRKIIDNRQVAPINLMLMNFALPASLFVAMARTPVAALKNDAVLAATLAGIMLGTYAATWWLQIAVFHVPRQQAAVQSLTVAFPNCAAVGLSILPAVFGPGAASIAALGIAVGAIIISPLTIGFLEQEAAKQSGKTTWLPQAFLMAFRRPVVLAPILGIVCSLCGIGVHDLVARMLLLLGQGAAGIALFLTGLILSAQGFQFSPRMGTGVLLKNIAQPLLMFFALFLLHQPAILIAEAVLLTAVPAGFFGVVFGARFGVQAPDASSTLIASTLLSIVTLGSTIFFLRMLH